jgi:hypothetical protein
MPGEVIVESSLQQLRILDDPHASLIYREGAQIFTRQPSKLRREGFDQISELFESHSNPVNALRFRFIHGAQA